MTLTDSRITATATGIPEKLMEEIRRVLCYYNQNSLESNRVVFLEIDGIYYKGRVTLDDKGNVTAFRKLTVDNMRIVLSAAGRWRTRVRYSRDEINWRVTNGGKCPRDVAYFAIYEMSPENLPELAKFRIDRRED